MSKLMHLLIMYHHIHRLHRAGFSVAWISREVMLNRRTVTKYIAMSEEEFLDYKHQQLNRKKLLEPYEDYIRSRLEDCPEASAAQVHDWLKEHFDDLTGVNEKTVFNFVLYVRDKYGIPKPFNYRDCAQVEELPYGKQAQVDFGEFNMTTEYGKRKKVYFFSMVLSRSRQKYVVFRDSPFTTLAAIDAHEKCFQFFQGIPEQLVYDQDKLMLVDENKGDLVLTGEFRKYVRHRGFKLHFCRKADPQSKGKIENVIKYIKYNFLRGRKYIDIDILNGQALDWLHRTANAKIHAATKKIPEHEWIAELDSLSPTGDIFITNQACRPYAVRKDNTIAFKGNFYRLPLGTYRGQGSAVNIKETDGQIMIYDTNNIEIARYKPFTGKGKLIGNNNFKRDYSSKINQLIEEMANLFNDPLLAKDYLQRVREDNPRYIRDQLLLIRNMTNQYGMDIMNSALMFCLQNMVLKATDMESLAKKLHVEYNNEHADKQEPIQVRTLNKSVIKIIPEKSNISDYKNLMN